jgi:hypothetical protein
MTLWNIFWRTFAQLAGAVLLGAQALDWVNGDKRTNILLVGLGLLAALVGAVVAVLWAFGKSPATTALEKAFRSAAEALAGGLTGLVINSQTDWVTFGSALVALGTGVVLAFGITYFQNQGTVTTVTPAP